MKKITLKTLFTAIICLVISNMQAQVGYAYTLIDNGNFSYSVGAVPDSNTSDFATSVQSYGFTILLPAGATASITSSIGGTASATPFPGSAAGVPEVDGLLITEAPSAPITLPAPSAGTVVMVTIQVDGTPSGTIEILANNDEPLASFAGGSLKSFMSADTVDDGVAEFPPVVDSVGSGLSGASSAVLSVRTNELLEFSVYPNPIVDAFTIKTANINIDSAKIFNINGSLVKTINIVNIQNALNISGLNSGVYFLQLTSGSAKSTIKLLKR